ncbi:hypothetical protein ACEUEG_20860, partial [Aeromonas media]|uniref:hypothetical protein n=1 Tax=Aeromonas media TaxID=651 RepID=UPI0038CF4380
MLSSADDASLLAIAWGRTARQWALFCTIWRSDNLLVARNNWFAEREFNFEVQFPIKNQAAFRSSSKTTCGCLNPKHLRGLKFSRFS